MSDKIRVLIVDDLAETRQNVSKLLQFESDIEVVGQASDGHEAIKLAPELLPDIILMDINMPGIDGIGASRTIKDAVPSAQIIIMSVQSDADYLRQSMMAGARDFLMKPFGGEELSTAIRSVYSMRPAVPLPTVAGTATPQNDSTPQSKKNCEIITVFSPKGGSGCTTVAINTAVSLAQKGFRTILIDCRLQFGDVSVMLNLKPTTTILDILDRMDELDQELIDSIALSHDSSLKVLLAPPRPEMAELVTKENFDILLESLKQFYDFIVIDGGSHLTEMLLSVLDQSHRIILIALQSLPSLKSVSHFFDLANGLDYEPYKITLIVNRSSNKLAVSVKDIGDILKRSIVSTIPLDEPAAYTAADRGYPLVLGPAQKRPIAIALSKLTDQLLEDLQAEPELVNQEEAKSSRFGRLFGSR